MAYDKIKFKHGLRQHLPQQADVGEPLYCIDTNELFIGNGEGRMPIGIVGPKGDKGDPGRDGKDGVDGKDGARGPQGEKGERGDIGPQGIQGERGERGPKGDPGLNGRNGVDGLPGERGPIGKTGPQGPQGKKGDKGEKGDPGKSIAIKGEKATSSELPLEGVENEGWLVQGDLWVWDNTLRSFINVGRIQGPAGPKGDKGEMGPAGPVNISDELDNNSSTTAASSKAVKALNDKLTQGLSSYIKKIGDVITGNLTFKNITGVEWDCGRSKKSKIFWNASTQNDYGLHFEVDGEANFILNKNQRPIVQLNGKWYYLATQDDIKNLSASGGDFVGKKMKIYLHNDSVEGVSPNRQQIFSINAISTEDIIELSIAPNTDGDIDLIVDDVTIYAGEVKGLFFNYSGSYGRESGGTIKIPLSKNFKLYWKIDKNGIHSVKFRAVHYYKQ